MSKLSCNKNSQRIKNYNFLEPYKHGIAKVCKIGKARNTHNIEYQLHTNGTIMLYISCSDNPFRLYEEQDISEIMIYLGRVEDRLKNLLSDTRDEVVPPVMTWILNACDINKDIEIDGMAQLTLLIFKCPWLKKHSEDM